MDKFKINKFNLVFLFIILGLIIFLYFKEYVKNDPPKKIKNKKHITEVYLNDDLFYKYFHDINDESELNKINLYRGRHNRQGIISEKGGSIIYVDYIIDPEISNISDNTVKIANKPSTYIKKHYTK